MLNKAWTFLSLLQFMKLLKMSGLLTTHQFTFPKMAKEWPTLLWP